MRDCVARRLAIAALKRLGYQVFAAGSFRSALQRLRSNPEIGVLIADLTSDPALETVKLAEAAPQIRSGIRMLFTSGLRQQLDVIASTRSLQDILEDTAITSQLTTLFEALLQQAP
jgi:CheY-like chemotaxis protein